jgi:hypothetical protein
MSRFSLKEGDRVFVSVFTFDDGKTEETVNRATVAGFSAIGIHYHDYGYHHYCNGLFYGFGYHVNGSALVVRRKWHIPLAVICEAIRPCLPQRISRLIGLE